MGAATMFKAAAFLLALWTVYITPAQAHVKWFLEGEESDILTQPKPDIFCYPSPDNVLILLAAALFFRLSLALSVRFAGHKWNQRLIAYSVAGQSWVSLLMGLFTGGLLLYCAHEYLFLVPNMPLDSQWSNALDAAELVVGIALMVGLFSRACALALLVGLIGSFIAYPALD